MQFKIYSHHCFMVIKDFSYFPFLLLPIPSFSSFFLLIFSSTIKLRQLHDLVDLVLVQTAQKNHLAYSFYRKGVHSPGIAFSGCLHLRVNVLISYIYRNHFFFSSVLIIIYCTLSTFAILEM